mmetsp:Transcript_28691/g.39637  ORF Transcript_28691/g.39637 Transcript_28691/m.39637 type:complete len:219 (-) Transcript_28691:148-804(-)|eukprot:CAMPEP_0196588072 /NCGR_PEP_ID=MMETSP1081-20130531/59505_1 /TAXON_ID=36882 /ORGANISM="Pyramimonas amylifera, Strain CCMP720" /LENGTH=218 /DNA_ID=CAMNT_0041910461 /DNA_START=297 /DNA_END=953 /DNA_ORIENTATION=+
MEVIQQAIEQNVLQVAKVMEDQLDDQIHRLENMGEEDLEAVRARRIAAMKRKQQKKQQWIQAGHGEYQELDNEKEFFAAMKGEERMVCHFYRNNWPCKVIDKHLGEIAQRHLETKFCKIDAEKSPFLTDKLKIWMLPTLALIKWEKITDYVVGLDDMGGTDDFKQEALINRLAHAGLVDYEDEATPAPRKTQGAQRKVRQGGPPRKMEDGDESSDFSD